MNLMTQSQYADYAGFSKPYVTELKQKKKLVWRPDPETGKMKIDADDTDMLLGRRAAPHFVEVLNNQADAFINQDITEKNALAQLTIWKAQNEKLKYETELGKLIPRDEALSQINEIASLVKSSVDNLKFHFKNNYDAKIAKKVSDDLDNMVKKLAGVNDD